MPVSLTFSAGTLYGFLLVLARVSGALVFVPLPGARSVPQPARIALSLGFTLALFSRWPAIDAAAISASTLVGWALAEAALGITIGLALAIVLEGFILAAQVA